MKYIEVIVTATAEEQQILIAELGEAGAVGFEEKDEKLFCYFNEDEFDGGIVNQIVANFTSEVNVLDDRNWNEVWESNFAPVVVGNFCGIRAHFHEPIPHTRYEIVITPKMSFGTGHHATTYMMIEQMSELDFPGREVFDFGTGTGILAVLAKKMGATAVTAIDVDEWSIRNAAENFQRNEVPGITLYESTLLPGGKFDIVLANINKNVLLQYKTGLRQILKNGGDLLLSGLLTEDEEEICSSYSNAGFVFVKRKQNLNWISLLFRG